MLTVPDDIRARLAAGGAGRVYGVASVGDTRLDVEPSGSVTTDGSGSIQSSTRIHVFGYGDSLVPRSKSDVLAPYGQEVSLFRDLLGSQDETLFTVPLGVFRVTGNSGARETVRRVGPPNAVSADGAFLSVGAGLWSVPVGFVENPPESGRYEVGGLVEDPPGSGLYAFEAGRVQSDTGNDVVLDWEIDVELADRFRILERAKLIDPKSPVRGNTMYDELRRLSLFPLQETLDDVPVPAGMVYTDRLSAMKALAELAGGVLRLTRQGVLTLALKSVDPAEVEPVFDIEGTIQWDDEQSDEFYNYVWAHSDDGKFNGYASIDDDSDPLSVGRAGPSTFEFSSPLIKSNGGATLAARTRLAELQRRSQTITVLCTPEALLLELGDVGWMRDPVSGREALGEVAALRFPLDVTVPVEVDLVVTEG